MVGGRLLTDNLCLENKYVAQEGDGVSEHGAIDGELSQRITHQDPPIKGLV